MNSFEPAAPATCMPDVDSSLANEHVLSLQVQFVVIDENDYLAFRRVHDVSVKVVLLIDIRATFPSLACVTQHPHVAAVVYAEAESLWRNEVVIDYHWLLVLAYED